MDAVEPPPPGFESLPLTNNDEEGYNRNSKHVAEASHHSRSSKRSEERGRHDEELPRKRHRSRSQSKEHPKPMDRSLTPPVKITTPKMLIREREYSPKTPERRVHDDEYLAKAPGTDEQTLGKENKAKSPPKERKKKKKDKDKAERKKSKKDKRAAKKEKLEQRQKKSSSMNRSDSDINNSLLLNHETTSPLASPTFEIEHLNSDKSHAYIDIDACKKDEKRSESVSLSKWELDESNLNLDFDSAAKKSADDDHSEITSDVLRKAENAIFAKAINAIRPVEFQVIINSKGSSKDRSVAIRNDKERTPTPPPKRTSSSSKSVKERLGNKVVSDRRSVTPDKSKSRRRQDTRGRSSDDSRKRDNRSRDRSVQGRRHSPENDKHRQRPYNKDRSDTKLANDDLDRRGPAGTPSPTRVA